MIRFEVSASDLRAQGLLRDRGYTENLEVARYQNIAVWEGVAYFEELSKLLIDAGIPFVCCDSTSGASVYRAFDGGDDVQSIPDIWTPSFRFGAVAHQARARMAAPRYLLNRGET